MRAYNELALAKWQQRQHVKQASIARQNAKEARNAIQPQKTDGGGLSGFGTPTNQCIAPPSPKYTKIIGLTAGAGHWEYSMYLGFDSFSARSKYIYFPTPALYYLI